MPRVSVAMASYNHAPYVEAAIRSVLDQTFGDLEIVVTDDGSTDGTADHIARIDDRRVRLHRFAVNRGAVVAVNDALRRSTGEYLAVLNSDDIFLPGKLARQVAFLDANPQVGAVFARPSFIDHDGMPLAQSAALNGYLFDVENRSQSDWLRHFFFLGNCLCHPTILVRRTCYDRVGLYDARLASLPDLLQWIRLVQAYPIVVLPDRLIAFRCLPHGQNASSGRVDNVLRWQWENPVVLRGYAALPDALFEVVFGPEIAALGLGARDDKKLVLGRICLATDNPTLHRLGLDLLFDALPADGEAMAGDFRHAEFHRQGTGAKDIHNLVAVSRAAQLEAELRDTKAALRQAQATRSASRPSHLPSIVILDDARQQGRSGSRADEYRYYLDALPNLSVHTTDAPLIAACERDRPDHVGRILSLNPDALPPAAAYYMASLKTATAHLAAVERQGSPFVFSMDPGCGPELDEPNGLVGLERVMRSPRLSRVIATQPAIRDYLLAKALCDQDKIMPIFGAVVPAPFFEPPPPRPQFMRGKPVADLCFVTDPERPPDADPGYVLFVQVAQLLCEAGVSARFHVAGAFDASTIPLGAAAAHVDFYGPQATSARPSFYRRMDVIVSPTGSSGSGPGLFGRFPPGPCVEAGLQGVGVLCANELGQEIGLRDGVDICIIRPEINDIVLKLATLLNDPGRLSAMRLSGRERLADLYGPARQLQPRLNLLRSIVAPGPHGFAGQVLQHAS